MSPHGVWVKSTHLEWKEGPYAREGVKCHDCHMTCADGYLLAMGNRYPDVCLHLFHGAHDPGKVRGVIARNISHYLYFFFGEKGKLAGLEDAFLMFTNVWDDLDIYIGQFQVSDPLFKRGPRLSYEGYQIYESRPGLSGIDLTCDRGIMFTCGLRGGTDLTRGWKEGIRAWESA
jgi:hypothetical protein